MLINYLNFWFSIPGVKTIIELFEKEKYDIRFVGGCIRNAFLSKRRESLKPRSNLNNLNTLNNLTILNERKSITPDK